MFRVCHLPPAPGAADVDDLVVAFFGRECPPAVVRAATHGFDASLWQRWLDLGPYDVLAMGDGAGAVVRAASMCLAAGEVMAPIPIAETLAASWYLGAPLAGIDVLAAGDGDVDVDVLPYVAGGSIADRVLYRSGGSVLASSDGPGERIPTSGRLPVAHRHPGPDDPVVGVDVGAWDRALVVQRLLTTAVVLGSARRAHAVAVAYAKERQQFGRTIGSFQAVAHRLADIAAALTGAELLVRAVAGELDAGEDADGRVGLATAFVLRHAEVAATESLHLHGGYGFTLEEDIHLHVQHIRSLSQLLGGTYVALRRATPHLSGGRLHR